MANYTLELDGEVIAFCSNKILSEDIPSAWRQDGLDSIDFTLLWRHFAQQLDFVQIANDLCVYESQSNKTAVYFKNRIPVLRRIIRSCAVDQSRLRGLAKLLPNFLP